MAHTIKAEDLDAAIMHTQKAIDSIWETLEPEDPESIVSEVESEAGELVEEALKILKDWKSDPPKTEAEALGDQRNILYRLFVARDKMFQLYVDFDGEMEQPDQVAQELEQAENALL